MLIRFEGGLNEESFITSASLYNDYGELEEKTREIFEIPSNIEIELFPHSKSSEISNTIPFSPIDCIDPSVKLISAKLSHSKENSDISHSLKKQEKEEVFSFIFIFKGKKRLIENLGDIRLNDLFLMFFKGIILSESSSNKVNEENFFSAYNFYLLNSKSSTDIDKDIIFEENNSSQLKKLNPFSFLSEISSLKIKNNKNTENNQKPIIKVEEKEKVEIYFIDQNEKKICLSVGKDMTIGFFFSFNIKSKSKNISLYKDSTFTEKIDFNSFITDLTSNKIYYKSENGEGGEEEVLISKAKVKVKEKWEEITVRAYKDYMIYYKEILTSMENLVGKKSIKEKIKYKNIFYINTDFEKQFFEIGFRNSELEKKSAYFDFLGDDKKMKGRNKLMKFIWDKFHDRLNL